MGEVDGPSGDEEGIVTRLDTDEPVVSQKKEELGKWSERERSAGVDLGTRR